MLTVLKGSPGRPVPDYYSLYLMALDRKSQQYARAFNADQNSIETRDRMKQILYLCIKFFNLIPGKDVITEKNMQLRMSLVNVILAHASLLTPREFSQIFPITKSYDGKRREVKDYFSTLEAMGEIGMDNLMGEKARELFWDYQNRDVRELSVNILNAYSGIRQLDGHPDIMVEWMEKQGVSPLYMQTDGATGTKFLYDPKTGKTTPVIKKKPRYLRLIPHV